MIREVSSKEARGKILICRYLTGTSWQVQVWGTSGKEEMLPIGEERDFASGGQI